MTSPASKNRFSLLLFLFCIVPTLALTAAESNPQQRYQEILETVQIQFQEQKYDQAVETCRQAVAFAEEQFGEDHTLTTNAIFTLAQIHQSLGQLDEAERWLLELIDRYRQSFDAGELDVALARESLASVYTADGAYAKALALYEEVLKSKKALLGDDHLEISFTLNSLGELYRRLGRYDEAEPLFARAVEIYRQNQGDRDPILYNILANQAKLFEDMGAYQKAETIYRQVLEFDRETLGARHPSTLIDRNNIAGIHRKQGYFRQAEVEMRSVLESLEAALGIDHPETITARNNLGLLYENLGLYDKAETYFNAAVQQAQTVMGKRHPKTLAFMNNLAMLYEAQGIFDKAEALYRQTIEISQSVNGADHPDTIGFINNLAFVHLMQQQYQPAAREFARVHQLWQLQLGRSHQNTLKALNNLGRSKHYQGELAEAEDLLTQALTDRRTALGERHPDTIRSMIDLAALYQSQQKLPKAIELQTEALETCENVLGDKHPYCFDALNSLSDMLEATGRLEKALDMRNTGFERRSEFFDRVLWAAGENTRQNYIRLHKDEQDDYLHLLHRLNNPKTARYALDVSLQRKGLLLKTASEIHHISRMADDPALAENAAEVDRIQKTLAALTLSGPTDETPAEFQSKLLDLENRRNRLQARLAMASRRYRNTSQPVTLDDVIAGLDPDSVLIDFIVYRDKRGEVLALIAHNDPGQDPRIHMVHLGKQLIVQQAVSSFRTAIQDEDVPLDEVLYEGETLYKMLWKPLEPYIGDKTAVYLVPDSILHLLPFDALVDEEGRYLLQTHDLKVLSSARDLAAAPLLSEGEDLLIFAGPDYDLDTLEEERKKELEDRRGELSYGLRLSTVGLRSLSFDPLIDAQLEGMTIKKVSDTYDSQAVMYIKQEAEEERLRKVRKTPRILHIATHGFFLKTEESLIRRLLSLQRGARNRLPPPGDNPLLRAGLAFAGINNNAPYLGDINPGNDGVLTAMEVLDLHLAGTELVVLSACETGVGEIHDGEGVYSLRRAFQEAGVENVLNSLWPVSDEGTRRLMVGLYQRLLAGTNTQQALKAAQLELLNSEWHHPYYWAAFVLIGVRHA